MEGLATEKNAYVCMKGLVTDSTPYVLCMYVVTTLHYLQASAVYYIIY